ncbi:LysR substrate-binding domain-containing protein [Cupriavidus necator]
MANLYLARGMHCRTACSYRRILKDWLATIPVVPDRVLKLVSYHAIVACVAAGSSIAIMPRSAFGKAITLTCGNCFALSMCAAFSAG